MEGVADEEACAAVAAEAELFRLGVAPDDSAGGPLGEVHRGSEAAMRILHDEAIRVALAELLGGSPRLVQSLYLRRGSQVGPHSDHMFTSTDPAGRLATAWIACEDVREDAGPPIWFRGSHRLPVEGIPDRVERRLGAVRERVDREGNELRRDPRRASDQSVLVFAFYQDWSEELQRHLAEQGHEPRTLLPRRGDAVIWDARLIHAALPITGGPEVTRKSLVGQYVSEEVTRLYRPTYIDGGGAVELEAAAAGGLPDVRESSP